MCFNTFKSTQDRDDFIHSIKRFCKFTNRNTMRVTTDPFILEIESINRVGKFSQPVTEFCKAKYAQNDKKLNGIYKAYLASLDRDDFIHSVNRYFKVAGKK